MACQRSKITRHTTTPLGTFSAPTARFAHIHMDLVGPLPPSNGYTQLLTCVDRFTRWPIAVPLKDSSAETIAKEFINHWVSIFGTPETITTDRGPQFESRLFDALTRHLGTTRIRTTAYHPISNGMVERFHRQLKAALTAQNDPSNWTEQLPLVLLGIRSTVKTDLNVTPLDMVLGGPVRLPGEFINPTTQNDNLEPRDYAERFKQHMSQLHPLPTRQHLRQLFTPANLDNATHVLVRTDRIRPPLTPVYEGPFPVIFRSDKYFTIQLQNRKDNISIDRLKPAFFDSTASTLEDSMTSTPPTSPQTPTSPSAPVPQPAVTSTQPSSLLQSPNPATSQEAEPLQHALRKTRSGRSVHWPAKFLHTVRYF